VARFDWQESLTALEKAYSDVDTVLRQLKVNELLLPSGCRGWTRADLAFHLLLDAQRALVAFHTPAEGTPDVDAVSYWLPFSSTNDDAVAGARFVRACAAAYRDPRDLVKRWSAAARAAKQAAGEANGSSLIATQGHVLARVDFVATLVVEANVHFLDLIDPEGDELRPSPEPLRVTTLTLVGLLGEDPPSGWDEITFARKATGRKALSPEDKASLGPAAARLPLFS
jgi:hypothetical protein